MSRFKILGASILALSLVAGASGAALGTDIVVGHGIPKAKVDVCAKVGGDLLELKSNFKFGQWFRLNDLAAGTYTITVRVAKPGNCNGKVLINTGPLAFDGSEDLSVIASKNKGKPIVVVFDNSEGYFGDGSEPVLSIKHAANVGKADVYLDILVNDKFAADTSPTATGVKRGDAVYVPFLNVDIQVGVARTGSSRIIAQTPYWEVQDGKINHVVAIGTPSKFRFLRYRTDNPGS
ncbi:MAG: DUF4397 domain-containing protein [Candidatus Limnocylindrales bacterium]